MNNPKRYGIRWHSSRSGVPNPKTHPEYALFASAYQPAVNGGGNCVIGEGDPITGLATGMSALCDGVEGAGGGVAIKGVLLSGGMQYDATIGAMIKRSTIAGGIVYGTNLERQTRAEYVPVADHVFEMDVINASTSFDTVAEYQAAIHANADHRLTLDSGTLRATPQLDLATVAATAAQWRILGLSKSNLNMDLTGLNAKVLVTCFEEQTAGI